MAGRELLPTEGLRFVQRRIGVRFAFVIGAEGVKYTARERGEIRETVIPYEALNPYRDTTMRLVRSPLLMNLFVTTILYLLLAAAFGSIIPQGAIVLLMFALATWIAFLVGRVTGWTDLRFRLLPLVGPAPGAWGPVKIIDDPKGERVLAAIRSAWADTLKAAHGMANLSVDPQREIARLTWLRDNHILTEEEWAAEVAKVREAGIAPVLASGTTH